MAKTRLDGRAGVVGMDMVAGRAARLDVRLERAGRAGSAGGAASEGLSPVSGRQAFPDGDEPSDVAAHGGEVFLDAAELDGLDL